MLQIALALLAAYLIGSLSGSLLLGRAVGVDIRQRGSGNAGGTNAFRTLGWKFALGVIAIDIGKGALAAWLGFQWHDASTPIGALSLSLGCVLAAVLGHTWPLFFGFRGGKGAGTLVGGLLVAWPFAVLPLFAIWIAVLVATGYVGLATVCAATSLLLVAWIDGARELHDPRLWFALAAAGFIVFTHRANLARLAAGNEHRFDRVRVWKRWSARGPNA